MLKKYLLILFILPNYLFSLDQFLQNQKENISVNISSSNHDLSLHDLCLLRVKITFPNSFTISSPSFSQDPQSETFPFKILTSDQETIESEGKVVKTYTFLLEPLHDGIHYLSFSPFQFYSSNSNKSIELYPDIFAIKIIADEEIDENNILAYGTLPLSDTPLIEMNYSNKQQLLNSSLFSDIDSKKNLSSLTRSRINYKIVTLIASLFILILLTFYLFKKFASHKTNKQEIDPYLKAITALKKLKRLNLFDKGMFKEFYFQITYIVREFIENKYNVKAPERTTEEFLQEMVLLPIFSKKMKDKLKNFLNFADYVKFANHHPKKEDCQSTEALAFEFIDQCNEDQDSSQSL